MTQRRGYSLIEMLVVMTLMAVVMSSITLVLHGLQRAERRLHDDADFDRTLHRLATQFRADAHAARGAGEIADDDDSQSALTLEMPDEKTVTYSIEPGGVRRLVRQGENTMHREWFALAGRSVAWRSTTRGAHDRVVTLIVKPNNDRVAADQSAAAIVRIDAAVAPAWPAPPLNSGENK